MGPRNAYTNMLDNMVSPITCASMNHQNQLEQMANEAMFATDLLGESYPVRKSKLPFEDFDQGGLTDFAETCQFGCQHIVTPQVFSRSF
jgi:hypothetical protein